MTLKPRIKLASHVFSHFHPEWRWKCESLDENGFTWMGYGADPFDAYSRWRISKPFFPEKVPS